MNVPRFASHCSSLYCCCSAPCYVCCWPPKSLLESRLAGGSFSSWREHCKHTAGSRTASRRQADERAGKDTGTAPLQSAANNVKANTYASLTHAEQWTAADCCCWQKTVHCNAQDMRRKRHARQVHCAGLYNTVPSLLQVTHNNAPAQPLTAGHVEAL